jgi:hypothetical protein
MKADDHDSAAGVQPVDRGAEASFETLDVAVDRHPQRLECARRRMDRTASRIAGPSAQDGGDQIRCGPER